MEEKIEILNPNQLARKEAIKVAREVLQSVLNQGPFTTNHMAPKLVDLITVATWIVDGFTQEEITEESDRCARAYGWEIGRGQILADSVRTSPYNPFLKPDWKNFKEVE